MKNNKNGKVKLSLIILIVVIVILVLIGVICFINRDKIKIFNGDNNTSEQANMDNNGENDGEEASGTSLIDMSNTENVKIVEGEKVNTVDKITKDRDVEGLKLTNIKIQTENSISMFTADVKNETGSKFNGGAIKLTFINSEGEEYADFEAWVPEIEAGGSNTINAGTTMDIVNSSDMKIELLK